MASLKLFAFFVFVFLTGFGSAVVESQADNARFKLATEALEWQTSAAALYGEFDEEADIDGGGYDRRSLFWRAMHYYISYGALSANRIPCPPRSGRSYYTHNCFKSRAPVNPYTRGCSAITRCRR